MSKIDFEKKQTKFKEYREKYSRQELRTIKLIAETVKLIIKNNNKNLSNNDIKSLCLKIYGVYNKIKHVRVRNMINQPAIKEKIDNQLIAMFTEKGIEPLAKVVELTEKGENAAKNTSDFIQVAKFYKDISEISSKNPTVSATETRQFNSYADLRDDKPSKIIQKIETTGQVSSDMIAENQSDIDQDSQKEQDNMTDESNKTAKSDNIA